MKDEFHPLVFLVGGYQSSSPGLVRRVPGDSDFLNPLVEDDGVLLDERPSSLDEDRRDCGVEFDSHVDLIFPTMVKTGAC